MTLGKFREVTKDVPDSYELEAYIPYRAVLTASGRGHTESGSIVKNVVHVATKLVEDTVIITTDETTQRVFIENCKGDKDEMLCDD